MAKPPRASSQNNSKQVRFDIKEGLRGMMKDSAEKFNAAQIQQRLMDRKRNKEQLQSVDDLKLSQQYSDLQASRKEIGSNQTKTSPVFGGSHRA